LTATCDLATGRCVTCIDDSACAAGYVCRAFACVEDPNADTTTGGDDTTGGTDDVCATGTPPNVLIVFDGSSSMEDDFPTARTAVIDVINATDLALYWGLMVYNCFAQPIEVQCGPATSKAVKTTLFKNGRIFTGTTVHSALTAARNYFNTQHAGEANYILFVGDGDDLSCQLGFDNDDVVSLIEEIRVVDEIKTLVLGYTDSGSRATTLNRYAVAGGLPLMPDAAGRRYFYSPVNDTAVLTQTLTSLARTIGVIAGTIDDNGNILTPCK